LDFNFEKNMIFKKEASFIHFNNKKKKNCGCLKGFEWAFLLFLLIILFYIFVE